MLTFCHTCFTLQNFPRKRQTLAMPDPTQASPLGLGPVSRPPHHSRAARASDSAFTCLHFVNDHPVTFFLHQNSDRRPPGSHFNCCVLHPFLSLLRVIEVLPSLHRHRQASVGVSVVSACTGASCSGRRWRREFPSLRAAPPLPGHQTGGPCGPWTQC